VLFSIEAVSPKETSIIISYVIAFAAEAFERVRAWQALSGF